MGATDFGLDEAMVKKCGRLPKKALRELQAATRRMVPAPELKLSVNGHPSLSSARPTDDVDVVV